MAGRTERLGRAFGRLVRPAYRRTSQAVTPVKQRLADAVENTPYSVKYNAAVVAAKLTAIAIWGFYIFGPSWLIANFFGGNIYVIAAIYGPILIWANWYDKTSEDKLPGLWRVLTFPFIRKR